MRGVVHGCSHFHFSLSPRLLLVEHADITEQVLLPATGHAPHMERPNHVAEFLLDFFSNQASGNNTRPAD